MGVLLREHKQHTADMDVLKHTLRKPTIGWQKFVRALELTTHASVEAEAFLNLMECDWRRVHGVGMLQHATQDAEDLMDEPLEQADGSYAVIVSKEGDPGEIAPDMPEGPLSCGEGHLGRRAVLFRRYWVARVHEQYPRVVGDWSEPSLACTRLFLCKAMKEPRVYYVEQTETRWVDDKEVEVTKLVRKCKRGMSTSQIAHCVDWIVSAAHLGTPAQAAQRRLVQEMKPNWLMRMFGLRQSPTSW